jgi:D-glycero-D-manno-heptose 1,7-bisphosphate phosphatase
VRPAIFFDRDGTLSHEVGYVNHRTRFQLYPFAADAIRAVNRAGFAAVVVTNQAGVARGYFPETLVTEVHEDLVEALTAGDASLEGLYYCPHHPTAGKPPYRQECDCRKPRPGMLLRAAAELDLDLTRSWMVGDRHGDLKVIWSVGGRGAMVMTGYGRGELEHHSPQWTRPPDLVAEHALEAVERILHA